LDVGFEELPVQPVRGRVLLAGLKQDVPQDLVPGIFGALASFVSPGGVEISRGEAPKTWDATVSFDSEDAAYRAANYVRAFLLDAPPLSPQQHYPPSPSSPASAREARSQASTRATPASPAAPHKLVVEAIKAKTLECHIMAPMVFAEVAMEWLPADTELQSRPGFEPQAELSSPHMAAWSNWRP